MGTPTLVRPARLGPAIAVTMLIALAACETDPSGPGAPRFGHLRVTPQFGSAVDPGLLGLDSIHVTVELVAGGALVDTGLAYTYVPDDTLGWVVDLGASSEQLMIRARVLTNATAMFAAETTLVLDEGPIGTSEVQVVLLPYTGPGLDVDALHITPRDSAITWGDTVRFRTVATNAGGDSVSGAVVVWTTSDTAVASIDAGALLQAPTAGRGTTYVVARTPTGVADSALVRFQPPPETLAIVRGDADTANVNAQLALEVRVLGVDAQPVEYARVRFRAPTGAAVADSMIVTGPDGTAATIATLGPIAGGYTFEAAVLGVAGVTFRTVAQAGPAAALVFTSSPASTAVSEILTPPVEVAILDAFGNIAVTATDVITVALATNPGGALLAGTTSLAATAGVAAFADLSVSAPGTGYTLRADADGLTGAVSDAFAVEQLPDSVELTPSVTTLLAIDDTVRLTAVTRDAAGAVIADADVTWVSTNPAVATVDGTGLVTALADGVVQVIATAGTASDTAVVSVVQTPAAVHVLPDAPVLNAFGAAVLLAAWVTDANGFAIGAASLTWHSLRPDVATVDSSGLVHAVAQGDASIVASSGTVADTVTVAVRQVVQTVQVTPPTGTLSAIEAGIQLTAVAADANGHRVASAGLSWSSSDSTTARVDAQGRVTAVANGTASIVAAAGNGADTAHIVVEQRVQAVRVTPPSATLTAFRSSLQLAAVAEDANGFPVAGSVPAWRVAAVGIATVDTAGLVTALANGSASVIAEVDQVADTAAITVRQRATSVQLTPEAATLSALADTVRLAATAFDANAFVIDAADVAWTSTAPGVATVDQTGLVTARDNAVAHVVAATDGVADTTAVTVQQRVANLTLTPGAATLVAIGDTIRLTATATDANQFPVPNPSLAWTSQQPTIVTVDADGLATALANGAGSISVSADDASVAASLAVQQVVASVVLLPDSLVLTALADTVRFFATALDANEIAVVGTDIAWASVNPAVATADPSGLITSVENGGALVIARAAERADTASIRVAQRATSITVQPTAAAFTAFSDTVQLTASAFDANGHPLVAPDFRWATLTPDVVTVDSTGVVTAVGNGSATVSVTADDSSATAAITVAQRVATVGLAPGQAALAALDDTVRFTAEAQDANGFVITTASFSWTSSTPAAATVDLAGLVTAVDNGETSVTATAEGISAAAPVTVRQIVDAVTITPGAVTLTTFGAELQFEAFVADANGHVVVDRPPIWGLGDDGVITLDPTGLVRAIATGVVPVEARAEDIADTAVVTVDLPGITITFDTDPIGSAVPSGAVVNDLYAPLGVTLEKRNTSALCLEGPFVYANDHAPSGPGSGRNDVSLCPEGTPSGFSEAAMGTIKVFLDAPALEVCINVEPTTETGSGFLQPFDASGFRPRVESTPGMSQTLCVAGTGILGVHFAGAGDAIVLFDDLYVRFGAP